MLRSLSFPKALLMASLGGALVACSSAEAGDPAVATDDVVTTVGRATLDGYWKRTDDASVLGFTFNKCIGLDGRAEVALGGNTGTCKAGAPDVGSYLIHGKSGAPAETGTYRIAALPSAKARGKIELFKSGSFSSYTIEYAITLAKDEDATLRLFPVGAAQGHEYRARTALIPASCEPANEARMSGEAFLGPIDYNWFRHDHTIGQRNEEIAFEAIYASRPFRFGYPACDVQLKMGMVDTDHVNAVCDGAYEVGVGNATDSVVWKERATTVPRFYSLSEALHIQGGDGAGWMQTIGTALTPLVDLKGASVAGCEAKLGGATGEDRVQKILETSDNACKILLAPGGARLTDGAGAPRVRYVQVFEQAVLTSAGVAGDEACVTKP
jgi:hypothetical protein